ncbi:hypothetical protein BGZ61DRAFT_479633 [Ilyonectria robusta]|uniref:uncharacterized protein n=1 Tax=Ilyonectria robusta TaxID=1079257 RepID=UPI001E8CDDB4|nr:uncharacterized protein BGZ61DRAFT_479633 [Ilyonectria robusta]KAH8686528.1 hypothetical protein BGZ61DRAFT_479633 [Ilyonectria robusta]
MSIIIGALGSIIGYLGAEAATESFFERLLWPERFYNDTHPYVLFILSICLPMAGPLHGAALESLDTFRKNGLYLGMRRGNMLGTTFFHDTETKYYQLKGPNTNEKGDAKESRNGFWVQVLREVKCRNRAARLAPQDLTDPATDEIPPYRSMQLVHHLRLHYATDADHAAVAKPFKTYWLTCYLLVPLVLKLIALFVRVRRDSILDDKENTEGHPESEDELYEIEDPTHGFAIIQGPPSVVLQFFRHYGHPTRDSGAAGRRNRARELLSMILIYLFVLYFPAGLISSLWMPSNVQLLWLSFQVYSILAMHVVRIVGWDQCGRTEARVARHLEQRRRVWLRRPDGLGIVAWLETIDVPNVDSAKREVDAIVRDHFRNRQAPWGRLQQLMENIRRTSLGMSIKNGPQTIELGRNLGQNWFKSVKT